MKEFLNYTPMQIKKLTLYLDDFCIINKAKQKQVLTLKQRAFSWYYVYNGNNKTDAVKKAYYSIFNNETQTLELTERGKKLTGQKFSLMGATVYRSYIVRAAIAEIQKHNEKELKTDLPGVLLNQLIAQATYDISMFYNLDLSFKSFDEIPSEYHCCIESIEKTYHGIKAQKESIKVKLVDREKARKYLIKLCPSIFVPEKLNLVHKTIDEEGKEKGINIDYSKMSDEELRILLRKICDREKKHAF